MDAIEEKRYSISDFNFSDSEILNLVERKVLSFENEYLKFTYVGLILTEEKIIRVFPKYYAQREKVTLNSLEFQLYLKVLAKLNNKKLYGITDHDVDLIEMSSLFGIYNKALSLFSDYGYYSTTKVQRTDSYEHKISWPKTIETMQPIFVNGIPVYYEVVSFDESNNSDDVISEFYKHLVYLSFQNFGAYMGYDNVPEHVYSHEIEDEFLLLKIGQRMNETYIDSEIQQLSVMRDFLLMKAHNFDEIELFGTTVFYHVWEAACKVCLADEYNKWSHQIPHATWEVYSNKFRASAKLIPDILKKSSDVFYILDAKYYSPSFKSDFLKGEPDTYSVTKQILYEFLLEKKITDQTSIISGFLFPEYEEFTNNRLHRIDDSNCIGSVYYDSYSLPRIRILLVPEKQLFNSFLSKTEVNLQLSITL